MATVFKRGGKNNRGGYYYVSWFDHTGRRRTACTRTTDKASAERIAAKHEADAALRRDGVIDPTLDSISRESQRTVDGHLIDFEAKIRAANRTEGHVTRTVGFIRTICQSTGFAIATDISADGVHRYVATLRNANRSARTIQAHLTAIKGFTKWLSENHKLPRDPLASVRRPNPKADRRKERRMLLPTEWHWLHFATSAAAPLFDISGAERVLLYRTAIETGLRSAELRSLTRGRLYSDRKPPFITCKAGSTKNRKDAKQYIMPDLAAALQAHVLTKSPQAPMFMMPDETDVASMLRADLAEARTAWIKEAIADPDEYARREQSDFLVVTNHDGQMLDFHSLRHTCGAWLAMAGVHPKAVQTVMRHGSIGLTMDTYGHLFPGQEADAVGRLHEIMGDKPHALQATGTHGTTAENAQRVAQRTCSETPRSDAMECEDSEAGMVASVIAADLPKALRIARLDETLRDDATSDVIGRDGTRTHTPVTRQGILSPQCLPFHHAAHYALQPVSYHHMSYADATPADSIDLDGLWLQVRCLGSLVQFYLVSLGIRYLSIRSAGNFGGRKAVFVSVRTHDAILATSGLPRVDFSLPLALSLSLVRIQDYISIDAELRNRRDNVCNSRFCFFCGR